MWSILFFLCVATTFLSINCPPQLNSSPSTLFFPTLTYPLLSVPMLIILILLNISIVVAYILILIGRMSQSASPSHIPDLFLPTLIELNSRSTDSGCARCSLSCIDLLAWMLEGLVDIVRLGSCDMVASNNYLVACLSNVYWYRVGRQYIYNNLSRVRIDKVEHT